MSNVISNESTIVIGAYCFCFSKPHTPTLPTMQQSYWWQYVTLHAASSGARKRLLAELDAT